MCEAICLPCLAPMTTLFEILLQPYILRSHGLREDHATADAVLSSLPEHLEDFLCTVIVYIFIRIAAEGQAAHWRQLPKIA